MIDRGSHKKVHDAVLRDQRDSGVTQRVSFQEIKFFEHIRGRTYSRLYSRMETQWKQDGKWSSEV